MRNDWENKNVKLKRDKLFINARQCYPGTFPRDDQQYRPDQFRCIENQPPPYVTNRQDRQDHEYNEPYLWTDILAHRKVYIT